MPGFEYLEVVLADGFGRVPNHGKSRRLTFPGQYVTFW
jgi:hypothetical protein